MSKVSFEPMPGKLIVKTEDTDTQQFVTRTGLYLVQQENTKPQYGKVVATYQPFHDPEDEDDVITEPFIKEGDEIIFGKHSGIKFRIGRDNYIALRESEVMAKIIFAEEDDLIPVPQGHALPADYAPGSY